jgi:hypothetical protein
VAIQYSSNISAADPGTIMKLLKDTLVANGWKLMGSSSGSGGSFTQSTTIAAGSNGAALPQATINVVSTTNFPTSGTITIYNNANAAQTITYTGKTATTFTGCSGGTGTLATGGVVSYDWWTTTGIAGTSGAWIRLQMPTANSVNRELVFQRGTTGDQYWNIRYSYSTAFSTGGSTTAVPTATGSQVILDGTAAGTLLFVDATSMTALVACDNATPYGFALIANGTGTAGDGVFMDPMVSGTFDSADVDPYVFGAGFGIYESGNMGVTTTTSFTKGYHKKGLGGEGFVTIGVVGPYCQGGAGTQAFFGVDAYSGYDVAIGMNWARIASATAPRGWKGTSTFFKLIMVSRNKKDTISTTGTNTRDYMVCSTGEIFAIKWSGVVPSLWQTRMAL